MFLNQSKDNMTTREIVKEIKDIFVKKIEKFYIL